MNDGSLYTQTHNISAGERLRRGLGPLFDAASVAGVTMWVNRAAARRAYRHHAKPARDRAADTTSLHKMQDCCGLDDSTPFG